MAEYQSSPARVSQGYDAQGDAASALLSVGNLRTLTNVTGAALSLALIAGIAVWGYKLVIRDVSGIPVVRAAEGAMRVRPEDPGGQLAQNQGLAVNAVAAEGVAAAPSDRLVLAPRPIDLTEEDVTPALPAAEPVVAPPPLDLADALEDDEVAAIVRQLSAPKAAEVEDEAEPVLASLTTATDETEPPVVVDGLAQSLRPVLRQVRATSATGGGAAALPAVRDVPADQVATGTRLAQLGAFDSPDIARAQWDKIAGRFDTYLDGKDRVIQQAQSGGRTFYRLRAMGFDDLSDARRFCSALVAEGADCIPVVSR